MHCRLRLGTRSLPPFNRRAGANFFTTNKRGTYAHTESNPRLLRSL